MAESRRISDLLRQVGFVRGCGGGGSGSSSCDGGETHDETHGETHGAPRKAPTASSVATSPTIVFTTKHGQVSVCSPPDTVSGEFEVLFTQGAAEFIAFLHSKFNREVEDLHRRRAATLDRLLAGELPDFIPETKHIREDDWRVAEIPPLLLDRRVDVGDTAPHATERLVAALNSGASGIQADFDDGFCPIWRNVLRAHANLRAAVRGTLQAVTTSGATVSLCPTPAYIMFRPRSWNMTERNVMVDGTRVAGPLFDFAMYMYHNGAALAAQKRGPYCYFPKVETYLEARLWNRLVIAAQAYLSIPRGTLKATVLIESLTAVFQMHEILYELREHSAGLNCGMWDYAASFICKLGRSPDFIFPDRKKYVNMTRHFMKSYRALLVRTCHMRGAPATGGMAAAVIPRPDPTGDKTQSVIKALTADKSDEFRSGADGAMVYPVELVPELRRIFESVSRVPNQLHVARKDADAITAADLLCIPDGGATRAGLRTNVGVGIMFCEAWLRGEGHFVRQGAVEDSATAEISRSQVWQQIAHRVNLEDDGAPVTPVLVRAISDDIVTQELKVLASDPRARCRLLAARELFLELVTLRDPPQFVTTWLDEQHPVFSRRYDPQAHA